MNNLVLADRAAEWRRLKALVLDSVSDVHQAHYYGEAAWANELARRGYVVLVHDIFTFGSRRMRLADLPANIRNNLVEANPDSEEEIQLYNQFAGNHEHLIAKSLFCAGMTWPGVFVFDDQRALDYLASRPDVDATRIGCGGLSGGGLRTVMLTGPTSVSGVRAASG